MSPSLDDITDDATRNRYSKYSLSELKKMLGECVENEDYEMAAQVRDENLQNVIIPFKNINR